MKEGSRYKAVIFDLDGTLLDSLADYAAAANKVLKNLGFPVHHIDSYRYFTGDGMDGMAGMFKDICPDSDSDDE